MSAGRGRVRWRHFARQRRLRRFTVHLAWADGGNVAMELGLILAILGPVALFAGQAIGPAALDWSTNLYANVVDAAVVLADLCQAIADMDGASEACEP